MARRKAKLTPVAAAPSARRYMELSVEWLGEILRASDRRPRPMKGDLPLQRRETPRGKKRGAAGHNAAKSVLADLALT
jgi:hypothetical protein